MNNSRISSTKRQSEHNLSVTPDNCEHCKTQIKKQTEDLYVTNIICNSKHTLAENKKVWNNSLCDNCQWREATITCDCGFKLCNRKGSPWKECRKL